MAFSVFSENLRVYNAEQFIASVSQAGPTNIYLTFGRVSPWANDASPDQANSSVTVFNDVWDNMLGAKLITGNDIRHAIKRFNWTANTSYAMYDHCECSLRLFNDNSNFFVVTTDWNVYKCLSNNRGAISTFMPTQTITTSPVEEADGYIWKYMYTVTPEERLRFVTSEHIPVRNLVLDNNSLQWQVQRNAIRGGIEAIKVTNTGSNYSNTANVTVSISGDGTGARAVAVLNTSTKIVDRIAITAPGSNYTTATVSIRGGGGSGATARAIISPPGGHGSDPVRELGGHFVIMNPRLNNTEDGKFTTDNEFRQVSIIQDPKLREGNNVATGLAYTQYFRGSLSEGSTNYIEDEIVYQGQSLASAYFRGTVAAWDSTNNVVKLTNTRGTPQADVLFGATSATRRFLEAFVDKELLSYSGNLLYIDNISPISRANDQTEDVKIVLKF